MSSFLCSKNCYYSYLKMSFLRFLETKGNLLIFKQHFISRLLRCVVGEISHHFQLTFHHLHAQDKTILFSYFGLFALSEK